VAVFKELVADDVKTQKSYLNQLVDINNLDISGSTTRKKYQVYVTGGVGPGITSSLFQTVYDQDFTLATANAIFDMTFGLHTGSTTVLATNPTIDTNGKYLFQSNFVMMREKIDIYRLFAQELLGNADGQFVAKVGTSEIPLLTPMFICFKRLFARDKIKRETFVLITNVSAAAHSGQGNLYILPQATSSVKLYTDANSTTNKLFDIGGEVSTIVDSANTSNPVGMLFLDKGILVLDISRSYDFDFGPVSGVIDAINVNGYVAMSGTLKNLLMSASIDDVMDHFAISRFSGSSTGDTSIAFQNQTNINSSLYFCRLSSDEFNYSSNPTYTDDQNRIVVIDEGQEETQQSFTFITSVGLYDAFDNLLAVGKVSRPLLKDGERDLTLKLRLDYFSSMVSNTYKRNSEESVYRKHMFVRYNSK